MSKKEVLKDEEVQITKEQAATAERVSNDLKNLLETNGFALSAELVYGKHEISCKPILVLVPKND